MHGKATLILTDKDTGRVVERREEHNLVTNALSSIFTLPNELGYCTASKPYFNGYLPMYASILKGLVLFGEAIPENAGSYMLGGKYPFLATAGDNYSGADAMRGSFNENQSCEIENGYRFVWDFAPEKAVGTIRCLALTSHFCGNYGSPAVTAPADSYFMINPTDLKNGINTQIPIIEANNTNKFFLEKGKRFYSYASGNNSVTIRKFRLPDLLAIKICDKIEPVIESETQISLGFSPNAGTVFYDSTSERLYFTQSYSYSQNGESFYKVKYAAVNPVTGEKISETADWILTGALGNSGMKAIVFGGKLYMISPENKISVCSLSGTLERTIDFGLNAFYSFLEIDGRLAVDCKLTAAGRRCIRFVNEPTTAISHSYNQYYPIPSTSLTAPYCYMQNPAGSSVYIAFRTDYLATINNLASPLVKTDRHALQVRYEITND